MVYLAEIDVSVSSLKYEAIENLFGESTPISSKTEKPTPTITATLLATTITKATITDSEGTINRSSNIRSGPGTSYAIVGAGKLGQKVTIIGTNGDSSWYKIGEDRWIAAFLVDTDVTVVQNAEPPAEVIVAQVTATPTPEPTQLESTKAPLPPSWKDAGVNICGNFEWKVVDVRRPDGLWRYGRGVERINESFLVVYVEIRNIGSVADRIHSIRPIVGTRYDYLPTASSYAAWMMTGGSNHPYEKFDPGAVITIAAAYDVPRFDAYSFSMLSCPTAAVNIGEWNALSKDAIRANTN